MDDSTFAKLHEQLEKSITSFPHIYLFKFIIPSDNQKLALLEALFEVDAIININHSSQKKYLSLSVKQVVLSIDEIITV